MANPVLTFDIGCPPPTVRTQILHPCESTGPREGFLSGRQYAPARATTRISVRGGPAESWFAVLMHWERSFGGVLRLDFVPPNGDAPRPVRMLAPPRLVQSSGREVSFEVDLEDAP